MRDYAELVSDLHICGGCNDGEVCQNCSRFSRIHDYENGDAVDPCNDELLLDAADAIEELLAFARFVAREAIGTGDDDGVSAEILCRKLNKLGLVEIDGEFWTLPAPPKEVE